MASLKFDFSNKHVLVTGGAQGIGRQIVEDFLASGARVTLWDCSEEPLSFSKAKGLNFKKINVSSFKECQEGASSLDIPLDILINNAGILRDRTLFKMTEKEYKEVIETNLDGVFYVTKSLLPRFNEKNLFKRIVNLSSVAALYGQFGQTNYVAAKAGVIGFTKVWSKELGRKGFTVNAITPGFVQTRILKDIPPKVMDSLIQKIPLARLGTVKDISNACLFLCSEESSYINGAVLSVDGGVTT